MRRDSPEVHPDEAMPFLRADELGRAVVETVRIPFLVLDADLTVVAANPAFLSSVHLEESAVVGARLLEIAGGRWDIPALRDRLEGILAAEGEVRDLELRVDFGEGDTRVLRMDARRVRLEGEAMDLILLSLEDVTAHVRFEERIERYARELERSNRDLEGFAHAASHDLQEPLRKIRTYVDRIAAALDEEALDERLERYLARMPEAVERMQTRIDDLLQLARIGRAETERRPTDLNEVVAAVLEDLEVPLSETGARVDAGGLPTLDVDPSQMRLLFQNLIANAVKFRKEDEAPAVRIRAEEVAGPTGSDGVAPPAWRIVAEDEGIGFEEEYAERIFQPFQRLHGRSTYEGSGVGLAICRRVAEMHDGTITAEGRPGTGARFVVTLPTEHSEEEPA